MSFCAAGLYQRQPNRHLKSRLYNCIAPGLRVPGHIGGQERRLNTFPPGCAGVTSLPSAEEWFKSTLPDPFFFFQAGSRWAYRGRSAQYLCAECEGHATACTAVEAGIEARSALQGPMDMGPQPPSFLFFLAPRKDGAATGNQAGPSVRGVKHW